MSNKESLYQGRDATIRLLEKYGFSIEKRGSKYFVSLRQERTSSALINENGSVHDFGSGFHGSIYDVLYESNSLPAGMSKAELLDYVREELGISDDYKHHAIKPLASDRQKKKPIDLLWFKETFLRKDLLDDAGYFELLKSTIKSIDSQERILSIAKQFHIGYSKASEHDCARLVMPIADASGNIMTLWRYNPLVEKSKRLRFAKDRPRIPFNLQSLTKLDGHQTILLCEGEKDVLNAVARGFCAVTSGGASTCFKKEDLELFRDRKILCVGDYDHAGREFNLRNAEALLPVAKKVSIGNWEISVKNETLFQGYDLTDYLFSNKSQTA